MMKYHPQRIRSLVLTNVEAYDQWPSKPERPYLEWIVSPVRTPVLRALLGGHGGATRRLQYSRS
jgi:hypothetical protein